MFYAETKGSEFTGAQYGTQHSCDVCRFQTKKERIEYIDGVNNADNAYFAEEISSVDARIEHKEQFKYWGIT